MVGIGDARGTDVTECFAGLIERDTVFAQIGVGLPLVPFEIHIAILMTTLKTRNTRNTREHADTGWVAPSLPYVDKNDPIPRSLWREVLVPFAWRRLVRTRPCRVELMQRLAQSAVRSSSFNDVFARVFSSTFLTMTAQ